MHILVIEDDDNKRQQLGEFLAASYIGLDLVGARSLNSGLRHLTREQFDVAIIDMTMPTFDVTETEEGGRPQAYGGRELLRKMARKGIETPAVVVTQFDSFGSGADRLTLEQLDQQLRERFPGIYAGSVYYSAIEDRWREDLSRLLKQAVRRTGDYIP